MILSSIKSSFLHKTPLFTWKTLQSQPSCHRWNLSFPFFLVLVVQFLFTVTTKFMARDDIICIFQEPILFLHVLQENGYQLLFLSARSISQAYITRQFLFNLKQVMENCVLFDLKLRNQNLECLIVLCIWLLFFL